MKSTNNNMICNINNRTLQQQQSRRLVGSMLLFVLNLFIAFPIIVVQCERLKGAAITTTTDRLVYLYDDITTSYPVIEYKASKQHIQQLSEYGSSSPIETMSIHNNHHVSMLFNETSSGYEYRPSTDPFEYRIIQFYDSHPSKCLDCEYFKDHYVKLAKRLHEIVISLPEELPFQFKISLYAISCPHHVDLCRKQQVYNSKVPTVRLYPPGSSSDEQMIGYDIHYQSIHPYYVLERLGISSIIQQNANVPTSLEFEEQWNIGTSIQQKRKHISSSKQSSKSHIEQQTNDLKNPLEIEYDINRVIDHFLQHYVHHPSIMSSSSTDVESVTTSPQEQNIVVDHTLNEVTQWRLKEFIILLHRTLPQHYKVHILLNELLEQFVYIVNDHNYLVQLIQEMKNDGRFIVKTEWSSHCTNHNQQYNTLMDNDDNNDEQKQQETYNEYTCGFWELLQSIAVGLVDYNEMAFDASERISTHRVMDIIQNTLQTFHGAGFDEYTKRSILYMYHTCGYYACQRLLYIPDSGTHHDWIQISLWLNEIQNYINVQLFKRVANQHQRIVSYQEEIDAQHPSIHDCPKCWTITRKGTKTEIIELNQSDMIFKYLKYHYGRQNDHKLLVSLKNEISSVPAASTSRIVVNQPHDRNAVNETTTTTTIVSSSSVPYVYNESDHYFTEDDETHTTTNHHQSASTMVLFAVVGMMVRFGMNRSSTQQQRLMTKNHPSISNLYDIDDYMHDKQA
jgi:hypothetical protein